MDCCGSKIHFEEMTFISLFLVIFNRCASNCGGRYIKVFVPFAREGKKQHPKTKLSLATVPLKCNFAVILNMKSSKQRCQLL